VSTLWTPGGENDPDEPQGAAPPGDAGGPDDEAAREQLRALREQLAQTPVADIVANHAIGLWELALLHLSAEEGTEPDLEEARLAIDGVAALDQSSCVLLNACVRLVKRVREHADFKGFALRRYGIGHMTGRNVPR